MPPFDQVLYDIDFQEQLNISFWQSELVFEENIVLGL